MDCDFEIIILATPFAASRRRQPEATELTLSAIPLRRGVRLYIAIKNPKSDSTRDEQGKSQMKQFNTAYHPWKACRGAKRSASHVYLSHESRDMSRIFKPKALFISGLPNSNLSDW